MEGSAIACNKQTKTALTNGSDDGPLPLGLDKGNFSISLQKYLNSENVSVSSFPRKKPISVF